jgi:hypothetical protein
LGWVFFLLLFFFVLFISFTCFATVSPHLIASDEGSTTHHLKKKIKKVVGKIRAATGQGKTRATTGQGSVESSARADRVESDAR